MNTKELWTVGKVLAWAKKFLKGKGITSYQRESEEMLSCLLGKSRVELYTSLDRPMSQKELSTYKAMLKRRTNGEPIQYITGFEQFWKYRFRVTPEVLIPRPETEVLVAQAMGFLDSLNVKRPLICDVGTGSGAILLSILADRREVYGVGIDISLNALQVAQENAQSLKVADRCTLLCCNLLSALKPAGHFHLITANMPYVNSGELEHLQREVKKEPRRALNGGENGLFWISRLVMQAAQHLERGGMRAIEIGHDQGEKALLLFKGRRYHATRVIQDQWGKNRVITAIRD